MAWASYRRPIEGFRELVRFVCSRGGRLFFYGEEKPLGTATERWGKDSRLQKQGLLEFKWGCLHQALNRLCTFAESRDENLIVIMDTENEKERAIQVQNSYAHVFNRTADPDHSEMRRLIESTMHVDSKLSANVQFADWIAAAVRRASNISSSMTAPMTGFRRPRGADALEADERVKTLLLPFAGRGTRAS